MPSVQVRYIVDDLDAAMRTRYAIELLPATVLDNLDGSRVVPVCALRVFLLFVELGH